MPGPVEIDRDPIPGATVTDAELRVEIRKTVRANVWPEGYRANYAVLLPENVSADNGGPTCAWHDWVADPQTSKKIFYSIIPYEAPGSKLCSMPGGPYPHGEDIDNAIDRLSHELSEVATNPWHIHSPSSSTAWFADRNGHPEIGDLCRSRYGARDSRTGADVILGGHPYLIQGEWSNADHRCSLGLPPPSGPHFVWLKRCAIIDEGSAGFHYPTGIYPARHVSCAKAKFVFRRTLRRPDRYVTVTPGHNPWLVWRDGWGCDGHSIWVCLYRFRNPIRGVTRIAYSAECGASAGCPSRLRQYVAY